MQHLQDYKIAFEQYLNQGHFVKDPAALYQPAAYIMELGGKRLRPILALMAHQLFDNNFRAALPVAMAVEVFHNFSLVHDDIMDEAPLRRGKPTVHHLFGLNAGILSGDVMLIYAYEYLLQAGDAHLSTRLVKAFNRCAIQVCEGQQWDVDFESRNDVSISEYLHMIECKTAALVACSLQMGAMTAGASDADILHLYEFGKHLGIAFQLQDDFLDTFGEAEKFGKKTGGDIVQNKKTFLILKALELADASLKSTLLRHMTTPASNEQDKIQAVSAILTELGVPAIAEAERNRYHTQALAHLDQVSVPEVRKTELRILAENLLNRDA